MKGLGKSGFCHGNWQDYFMCLMAIKEIYRLKEQEWDMNIERFIKHDLGDLNKYECMSLLQKLNRKINKLGGEIIERRSRYEQGK